jgi:CubicO group peptidase (beta-lactamase class C family)
MRLIMNLQKLLHAAGEQNLHILNIVVRQNGEIVAGHDFTEEKRINLWSVSKTFTSMGIGIAEDEGYFKLTDKLSLYFHTPAERWWDQLTIHDLLCMGTGQNKSSFTEALNEGKSLDNIEEMFFKEPIIHKPGTHFLYDNAVTYMLSRLISVCTGDCLNDFLCPRIYEPLGIEDVEWEKDINGVNFGCAGLYLSAHEVSKAGQLWLDEGKWGDTRLVPQEYIKKASMKQIDTSDFHEPFATADHKSGYGYQVWMNSYPGSYRMDGLYGQYVVIIPEKKAVITFISNEPRNMTAILELAWMYIIEQL